MVVSKRSARRFKKYHGVFDNGVKYQKVLSFLTMDGFEVTITRFLDGTLVVFESKTFGND